jgi:uncharacterized protein YndB with AHSA1/START domain
VARRFNLVTNWLFEAPIETVWRRLTDPKTFPTWWPGFERAEVDGDGGVGTIARYRVRGDFGMLFDLETRVEEMREPEYMLLSSTGDLAGTGEWRLRSEGATTYVTYTWNVEPTRSWVRFVSRIPGAQRRMARSHDGVMTAGGENLTRLLAEELGGERGTTAV